MCTLKYEYVTISQIFFMFFMFFMFFTFQIFVHNFFLSHHSSGFFTFFFQTIVDFVAELPLSKVVTTFIKGGLDSTWRSLADITREAAEAVEAVAELFDEFEEIRSLVSNS